MKAVGRTPMRHPKTPRSRAVNNDELKENADKYNAKPRDPVQVFCRVRPLQSDADLSCISVKNGNTVVLSNSNHAFLKQGAVREWQYVFKHVFESNASQRDVFTAVAQPLVENLLRGRNSLLFTYGVTGSGKTYTMTGDVHNRGILPRCLDAIFTTISNYQAKKFIFKPDHLNGFEILSEADALLERQSEMNQRFAVGRCQPIRRKDSDTDIASQASCDMPPLQGLDEDNMFAVFITYIEVYNNSVFDLLEDGGVHKCLQSKFIREDANHNMFVHGVTEIEVKSVEEAIEAFQKGQKRKRIGHTVLNAESSRSHSVFNIRLVQAPTDSLGEQILQDKSVVTISQLSLVDLAGSERSSRTKNTGIRLREAGNINNSLLTLRSCLEYLRENQQAINSGAPLKKIPYRDSKITHLFKNYFDGEGQVSMIVCVNPRIEDCDENMQVMKFAEMTQEVQIARSAPVKPDLGLTPGRRKANKLFRMAVKNLNDLGHDEAKNLDIDLGLVYSLGPNFPQYNLSSPEAENTIQELMTYLVQRIEKRKTLMGDLNTRCDNFRALLLHMEKENLSLRTEVASIKAVHNKERDRSLLLEKKCRLQESSIDVLTAKVSSRERQIDDLTRKLNDLQTRLIQKEQEQERQKKKFGTKLNFELDKKEREMDIRLREQRNKNHEKLRFEKEKLRHISNIIQSENIPRIVRAKSTDSILEETTKNIEIEKPVEPPHTTVKRIQSIPTHSDASCYYTPGHVRRVVAANNRHRRSRSTGDRWIEHRAPNPVPLDTILQPCLKNRKSVTKLTDVKELTSQKVTKYCLVSQDADTDGDVETKLFKGNVIPTSGGGAQVVFDDVELLKQKSPTAVLSPNRKRYSNDEVFSVSEANPSARTSTTVTLQELTSRCNIGIEGRQCSKRTKK